MRTIFRTDAPASSFVNHSYSQRICLHPSRISERTRIIHTGSIGAGFRLFRFRSPLLPESHLISLPPGTKMFQFPGCATRPYEFRSCSPTRSQWGFPIRTSTDQSLLGSSPRLFAACYVLRRSFKSRHPPHASLTFFFPSLRPQTSDGSDVRGQKRLTTGNFRSLSSFFLLYFSHARITFIAKRSCARLITFA